MDRFYYDIANPKKNYSKTEKSPKGVDAPVAPVKHTLHIPPGTSDKDGIQPETSSVRESTVDESTSVPDNDKESQPETPSAPENALDAPPNGSGGNVTVRPKISTEAKKRMTAALIEQINALVPPSSYPTKKVRLGCAKPRPVTSEEDITS